MKTERRDNVVASRWRDRFCSLGVLLTLAGVFTYRGWDARNRLMYLDEIFVEEALRPAVIYYRGFTDAFGETVFLHPFSGYLHTIVRGVTELILIGPLTDYPGWTFLFATAVWSLCAWLIFLAVRAIAGPTAGVLAALSLALLHASNLILLGQLNAVQWPMLVACVIAVALDYRPRSKVGTVAYPLFLVATSLNAALAFIPIAMLGWRVLALPRRKSLRDAVHFLLMAVPFTLQLLTYYGQQIRTVDGRNPWWYMWREIAYVPTLLLPGSLRESPQDVLSGWRLVLLLVFLIGILTTVFTGILVNLKGERRTSRLLVELSLITVATSIISVYFNGNLNHQYVLIPYVSAWTAVVVAANSMLRHGSLRPWGQVASMGAVFIFVYSSVGLWKNDFGDSFFSQPQRIDLTEAIREARSSCINKDDDTEIFLTSYSILLPCDLIRELR